MQDEKLTNEQREVRSLLETDYEGVEEYFVENLDGLKEFLEIRKEKMKKAAEGKNEAEKEIIDGRINGLLRELGAPMHLKGYKYLVDGIKMYASLEEHRFLLITKDIYPVLAKKYGNTVASVERAIRHIISHMDNISCLKSKYGYSVSDSIQNSEFLIVAAEIVKEQIPSNSKDLEASFESEEKTPKIKAIIIKTEEFHQEVIESYVQLVNIPMNIKGYNYVIAGIEEYIKEEGNLSMVKDLYPRVADRFNTTGTRVERAIRHAIEIAFAKNACQEAIEKIFGERYSPEKGKPTNSEFIATIADRVKKEIA